MRSDSAPAYALIILVVALILFVFMIFWVTSPTREASCVRLGERLGAIASIKDGECRIGNMPIALAYAIRGGVPGMTPEDLLR